MDKGDILTVAVGLVVILVIALIANPGMIPQLAGQKGSAAVQQAQVTVVQTPLPTVPLPTPSRIYTPSPVPTPILPPQPYRITYTANPFQYPLIRLPAHMETFGASDIPLRENATIPFAYIQESQGGLTNTFSVPYELWQLNISVTATRQPQYAMFKMVLCDAKTGAIFTGAEIQNGGSMYKVVRYTGKMYMIISVDHVDSFTITLETPLPYYEKGAASIT